jgi:antitoxin component of MazEF toxin-antitoxin module
MLVKVCKHGNSLSIRLGAYITQTTHIKRGDWVDVVLLSSGEIRIKPKTTPICLNPLTSQRLTGWL